jgi:hypothetical protein
MEANSGHLKIEAKGASQRQKSEGENWRHTPKVEVRNESKMKTDGAVNLQRESKWEQTRR